MVLEAAISNDIAEVKLSFPPMVTDKAAPTVTEEEAPIVKELVMPMV